MNQEERKEKAKEMHNLGNILLSMTIFSLVILGLLIWGAVELVQWVF